MIDFVSGCAGLFSSTFNAAIGQDFFLLITGVIVFQVSFGIFSGMSHRLRVV